MNSNKRIALFGGSFDPVHEGHLKIAELAVEQMNLDEVRFIPCRISPHKPDSNPTPGEHRLAMLKLATAELPWAAIDDIELSQAPPSYSYLTVQNFRKCHPDAQLYWILGKDQWEALPKWKHPEILCKELVFLVFSRQGPPAQREGWKMLELEGIHPASSTEIRRALAADKTPDWMPQGVLEYIENNALYRS